MLSNSSYGSAKLLTSHPLKHVIGCPNRHSGNRAFKHRTGYRGRIRRKVGTPGINPDTVLQTKRGDNLASRALSAAELAVERRERAIERHGERHAPCVVDRQVAAQPPDSLGKGHERKQLHLPRVSKSS